MPFSNERENLGRVPFAQEDSHDPLPHAAQNLIGDRLGALRNLLEGHPRSSLLAEEDGLVPNGHVGDLGRIYHGEIHRHAPDDRGAPATDQDLARVGEGPWQAVAIPHREHPDARGAFRLIGAPVAYETTRRDRAKLDDARLEGHDPFDPDRRRHAIAGIITIRQDPGPDHVEPGLRKAQDTCAIRRVPDRHLDLLPREGVEDFVEASKLLFGEEGVPGVRIREMGEDTFELQVPHRDDALQELERVPVGHPRTPHARIHFDVDPRNHLVRDAPARQELREFQARHARGETVLDDLVDFGKERGAQDHDRGAEPGRAKLDPLVQRGYAQHRDAGVHGRAGDLDRPVAIGIGLDDKQDLAVRTDRGADRRDVPTESIEVYFGPGGEFHRMSLDTQRVTSTTGRVATQAVVPWTPTFRATTLRA